LICNLEVSSQFNKHQRSAMKIYVKQVNSQIEDIVLEMRKFLTPSKKKQNHFLIFNFPFYLR
jgi:ribosomal protein S20